MEKLSLQIDVTEVYDAAIYLIQLEKKALSEIEQYGRDGTNVKPLVL